MVLVEQIIFDRMNWEVVCDTVLCVFGSELAKELSAFVCCKVRMKAWFDFAQELQILTNRSERGRSCCQLEAWNTSSEQPRERIVSIYSTVNSETAVLNWKVRRHSPLESWNSEAQTWNHSVSFDTDRLWFLPLPEHLSCLLSYSVKTNINRRIQMCCLCLSSWARDESA